MRILRKVGIVLVLLLAGLVGFAYWYDNVGQQSDAGFDTRVKSPAYPAGGRSSHPKVLIDGAHRNFHTATGKYKPFAELLRSDGYAVAENQHAFTARH